MKKIILFFCLFFASTTMLYAQGLLNQDLRQIHVDQLSDAEILLYYNKVQQAGISIDQAYQMAAAKGMPATEIQKLKQRIALIGNKSPVNNNGGKNITNNNNNS